MTQARRLGAEMVLARNVEALEQRGRVHAVRFDDGTEIEARAVVVATGVSYRLLEAPGLAELTGRGVFYGAAANDAPATEGDDVYIVGAANSAGQAALNLAQYAQRVVLLVRGDSLEKSMSQYLVERVTPPTTSRFVCRPRSGAAAATITWSGSCSPTDPPENEEGLRRTGCTPSSAPRLAPTGSATRSLATARASSSPGQTSP